MTERNWYKSPNEIGTNNRKVVKSFGRLEKKEYLCSRNEEKCYGKV